jgi:hypothetical protein
VIAAIHIQTITVVKGVPVLVTSVAGGLARKSVRSVPVLTLTGSRAGGGRSL